MPGGRRFTSWVHGRLLGSLFFGPRFLSTKIQPLYSNQILRTFILLRQIGTLVTRGYVGCAAFRRFSLEAVMLIRMNRQPTLMSDNVFAQNCRTSIARQHHLFYLLRTWHHANNGKFTFEHLFSFIRKKNAERSLKSDICI